MISNSSLSWILSIGVSTNALLIISQVFNNSCKSISFAILNCLFYSIPWLVTNIANTLLESSASSNGIILICLSVESFLLGPITTLV